MSIILILGSIIFVCILLFIILSYNKLIFYKNAISYNFSALDVCFKKRFDLISKLVNVVSSYKKYETELHTKIVEKRYPKIENSKELLSIQKQEINNLKNVFLKIENYPEIKANSLFNQLQDELINLEDEIMRYRMVYNNTIENYLNKIDEFPTSIIAKLFGFKKEEFFKLDDEQKVKTLMISFN
jgi:LemA protein